MSTTKPNVVIVGAGLAGLLLSLLLERAGIPYNIYERATKVKPLGSALGLGANILPIFEQLGLLDQLMKIALPCPGINFYDQNLSPMGGFDISKYKENTGYDFIMLARRDLYDLLLSQVPAERIHMNKKITATEQSSQGVSITCSDGTIYRGDILVGADGAHSAVRLGLYTELNEKGSLPKSDLEPMSIGYMCLVGTTDELDAKAYPALQDPFTHFSRVLGNGPLAFYTVTVPGNRVCWGALVQLDSSTVLSRDVTSLKNAEWGPESNEAMINEIYDRPCRLGCTMGALTDATPKDGISRVFLEEKIFETWYHNRTVLIGDGATNAMQDAIVLANAIYNLSSVTSEEITCALKLYHGQRYTLSKMHVEKSKSMAKLMNGTSWLEKAIRYVVFNWIPSGRRSEKVYQDTGYRPQACFLPLTENRGTVAVLPQSPTNPSK
ncbi:hypothetical protein BGZ68_008530 [Mortierella alpina]|nr:hypothetical protein BGZ68_008530 [Mortierella alpina]